MTEQSGAVGFARGAGSASRAIYGLDAVRFIAAMLVMLFHLAFWAWWDGAGPPGTIQRLFPALPEFPELVPAVWSGWVGVQTFFVISGFVIAMSAARRDWRAFVQSRFLRIYPTAFICGTVFLLPITIGYSDESVIRSLLAYANSIIISPIPRWLDGVYWTLAVELVFYFGVALLSAAGWRNHLLFGSIGLGLVSGAYHALTIAFQFEHSWLFTISLLQHGVFFALGCVIYYWLIERRIHWRIAVPVVAVLTTFCCVEIWQTAERKLIAFDLRLHPIQPIGVWLVTLALIVASVLIHNRGRSIPEFWRCTLQFAGRITYPLYLIHSLVGGMTLYLLRAICPPLIALVVSMLIVILMAALVVRLDDSFTAALRRRIWLGGVAK